MLCAGDSGEIYFMKHFCNGSRVRLSVIGLLNNKFTCRECGKDFSRIGKKAWILTVLVLILCLPLTMSAADFFANYFFGNPSIVDARFFLFLSNLIGLVLIFPLSLEFLFLRQKLERN